MKYDFDEIINRQATNAMSVHGFRDYLFKGINDLKLPCPDEQLISMWIADMDFAMAPEIIDGIKARLDQKICGYSQIFSPDYHEAFVNWCQQRYGWGFDAEHCCNAHGIVPALFDMVEMVCKADEKVLIFTPSYGFFRHAVVGKGRELICSDLINDKGHFYIDFEDVERKIRDDKLTLCLLCNPHNPTGRVWTQAELQKLGQLLLDNGVTIVSDEIHCDLLRAGQTFTPMAKLFDNHPKIITCMAPSKTFNLAGMMFANVIIHDMNLRQLWLHKNFPIVNPLSLAAAQAAYQKGQSWLEQLCDYLDDNMQYLQQWLDKHLPKAHFSIPESTYLAWVDVNAYFSKDINLTRFFAENAGVLLEGGNMFVDNADGFIRLNLACPRSKVEQAIQKIKSAILTQ